MLKIGHRSPIGKYHVIAGMIDFIEKQNIMSYRELVLYAYDNNKTWFKALCKDSRMIISYIKSRNNSIRHEDIQKHKKSRKEEKHENTLPSKISRRKDSSVQTNQNAR